MDGDAKGGMGEGVNRLREVDDGLLRIMLSRLDIKFIGIGEGLVREGNDTSTSSAIGDSTSGVFVIGVELLRYPRFAVRDVCDRESRS